MKDYLKNLDEWNFLRMHPGLIVDIEFYYRIIKVENKYKIDLLEQVSGERYDVKHLFSNEEEIEEYLANIQKGLTKLAKVDDSIDIFI